MIGVALFTIVLIPPAEDHLSPHRHKYFLSCTYQPLRIYQPGWMMEPERPAKRIRQACEQCRRKKSKCSGEKPTCATCWRLDQQCYYYGEPLHPVLPYTKSPQARAELPISPVPVHGSSDVRTWNTRMVSLENTVNKIMNTLGPIDDANYSVDRNWASPVQSSTQDSITETVRSPIGALVRHRPVSSHVKQTMRGDIESLAKTYSIFCASQPLPLFPKAGFVQSIFQRSDATLFAVIAASLQHVHSTDAYFQDQDARVFRHAAQSLAMEDVANGRVEISTLQTLCLVVLFDFGNGNANRALSLIALTSMLAQSVGFRPDHLSSSTDEEIKGCYWSIILLRRLLGITAPLAMKLDSKLLPYPSSCCKPASSVLRQDFKQLYEQAAGNTGIMVFVIEMSEEWVKVMAYVRDCLSSIADDSPWSTTSRYSVVMSGVMSIETRLQPLHRYKHVAFRDLTLEDLETSREYWAPWFLSRFLYHAMICLLNHPLLITLQLQAKGNDSELFRQQASFCVARHVRWILHFIAFIEARNFSISDPILGYCAAIVATIEYQLIYSVDEATAQKKKRNVDSCRRFIRRLSSSFRLMTDMDCKLEALGETISTTYASNIRGSEGVFVDLSRIRDILEICPTSPFKTVDECSNSGESAIAQSRHVNASRWVRLSRRPSVDQPDDSGSPSHDPVPPLEGAPQGPVNTPVDEVRGMPTRPNATMQNSTSCGPIEFPANLFFNGISQDEPQDVSTWWSNFESYDPDCPGF